MCKVFSNASECVPAVNVFSYSVRTVRESTRSLLSKTVNELLSIMDLCYEMNIVTTGRLCHV